MLIYSIFLSPPAARKFLFLRVFFPNVWICDGCDSKCFDCHVNISQCKNQVSFLMEKLFLGFFCSFDVKWDIKRVLFCEIHLYENISIKTKKESLQMNTKQLMVAKVRTNLLIFTCTDVKLKATCDYNLRNRLTTLN